ncbi:MAG: PhzF family phenazine biosynthesis protein, partial [Clostridia bacterium]|nr:PhzF family phenazine biosynthesis protein [Clostridia bacterium]
MHMQPYIIDAFTDVPFGGNAAGVVRLPEGAGYPPDAEMLAVAKKLGFSETAFILPLGGELIQLRYFTPAAEVALCGHATVASFEGLLQWGLVEKGRTYIARTLSGDLEIDITEDGIVWLDMAPPKELGGLSEADTAALYDMYGLDAGDAGRLSPAIVDSGLPDIMMPVRDRETLAALKPDFARITELSRRLEVTGVHVFTPGDGSSVTAYCRNFAPLYDIDEEAATGTSNGALSFYLYNRSMLQPDRLNLFIQGEAMGRPSKIQSRLTQENGLVKVRVGGRGVIR